MPKFAAVRGQPQGVKRTVDEQNQPHIAGLSRMLYISLVTRLKPMLTWKAPLGPAVPSGGAVAATLRGPSRESRKRNNATPETCKGQQALRMTAQIGRAYCMQRCGDTDHRLGTVNYSSLNNFKTNCFCSSQVA